MTTNAADGNGGSPLGEQFDLTRRLRLRNRLVATAHGRAAVYDGLPSAHDTDPLAPALRRGVGMKRPER